MIFLITGANGAGKSLFAVSLIRDILKTNKDPKALKYEDWIQQFEKDEDDYLIPIVDNPAPLIRPIFSNISGLQFDSDDIFTIPAGLSHPDTFPYGAVIFDDECHRRIPATGKPGAFGDPAVDDLDMHRHRGLDYYFMTQFPNKLHHVVRNLTSRHYHLQNIAGSQNASLFTWQYAESNPNDYNARQGADKTVFRYDKSLFDHYKSSSTHTRKISVPKKMWFLIAIFAFFGTRLVYGLVSEDETTDTATDQNQELTLSQALAPESGVVQVERPALAFVYGGCISSSTECRCYDKDLQPLEIEFADCKNMIERPLPTKPVISSGGKSKSDT